VQRRRGDIQGALATLRKAYELSGEEQGLQALASATREEDYERGQTAVARGRLAELEASEGYVSPLSLARLQAQAGEVEKVFHSLEAALAERSLGLVFLKVDPAWDRVRGDARFGVFVRKVGIP
jgi:hypothetical protein